MPITHDFVSPKGDGGDTSLLRPSDWNADHVVDALAPTGLTGATEGSRYAGATTEAAPASGTFAVGDFVIARTDWGWVGFSEDIGYAGVFPMRWFLRVWKTGTDYIVGWSQNGFTFQQRWVGTIPITTTHVGIGNWVGGGAWYNYFKRLY